MNVETQSSSTASSASGSATNGAARSTEEIEQDIHATRDELGETLDALESRLSPRQRMAAAADSLRRYSSDMIRQVSRAMSPDITTMIRMDHTHVLALFRRFRPGVSIQRKRALMANACLALEIHAELEEEIFYPALREVAGDSETLDKSVPEHDEMRALVEKLRTMQPMDDAYDLTVHALMRVVLHHVADEESTLLPQAESLMRDRLGELGMRMTKRRIELLRPHLGEIATTTARSFPLATVALAAGIAMIGWRALRPRSRMH